MITIQYLCPNCKRYVNTAEEGLVCKECGTEIIQRPIKSLTAGGMLLTNTN
jgi:DNA-directed RNA polymerase subunit RPC12/RpoP